MPAVTLPSWLTSITPAARYLTFFLAFQSVLLAVLSGLLGSTDLKNLFGGGSDASLAFPWLVLVPSSTLWYPWTLLTSTFVEVNLVEFILSLAILPLCGRYLERVWGSREFLKFVAFTVLISNIIAVAVSVIEFEVLGLESMLYGISYHGLMALQVAFLVAFTQLIPEHQVMLFGGLVKMKVKQLPMLYVGLSNVMCIIGYQSPYILIQFGWLVSWWYLRFLKWNDGVDFRGDRSETFAFKNWFPPFAQKYVGMLANFAFGVMVKIGLLKPWTSVDMESGVYAGAPGGARAEAERRRAMALKALDQRLASSKPTRPQPTASSSVTPNPSTIAASTGSSPQLPSEVVFDATDAEGKKEKE